MLKFFKYEQKLTTTNRRLSEELVIIGKNVFLETRVPYKNTVVGFPSRRSFGVFPQIFKFSDI